MYEKIRQVIEPTCPVHKPLVSAGEQRGLPLTPWLVAIGGSLLLSGVMITTGGNVLAGGAMVGVIIVIVVTVFRLDWGFYLFMFFVFLFDQYRVSVYYPFTTEAGYFVNINAIKWLPQFKEGVVTPMELHLLFLLFVLFLRAAIDKDVIVRPVQFKLVITVFLAVVAGSLLYSMSHGGDFVTALWEVRALFYLGIFAFMVPQIIQDKSQLGVLMWFCIAGISIKAFQGVSRYAEMGFTFGQWPTIIETFTNHEDPVFFITMFLFLLGLVFFGGDARQRRALMLLLLPIFLGFVAAQRRATYASLMASIVAFIVLLPKKERHTAVIVLTIFLLVFGAYLGAFWDSHSRVGAIAQTFKATLFDEGGVRGEKDFYSKLYREQENYNLAVTFQEHPVIGIGFGNAYLMPVHMWGSDFALGQYIPHNQILWVLVKMGVIGGFLFWLMFNTIAFRGAIIFSHLKDPYLKAVSLVCVIAIINQLVVSYADMQLTWSRNMVYLGTLIGLMSTLEKMDTARESVAPNSGEDIITQ